MVKYFYIIVILYLEVYVCQVLSQCLRPQSYSFVPRPMPEYIDAPRLIETPRYIETSRMIEAPRVIAPPAVISEPPCNNIVPITTVPQTTTTIITDCSPAVCKNLANTIQLMIVCNLLQNTKTGGDMALQLASPILNEILTTTTFPCGCGSSVSTNVATPYVAPNFIPTNIASPNVISPRMISPNVVSPNVISAPPNPPISNIQTTNGLLTSLMSLFGGGI